MIESLVTEEYSLQRIDLYLSSRFTYQSRSDWQKEILKGKLFRNSVKVSKPNVRVKKGDIISYEGMNLTEPEIDPRFSVIFEDEHLLGINKTGNLPVHPSGIFYRNTLLFILEESLGRKMHPLHRLDRETSGAILFAKNSGAASAIQKNFHRSVRKAYLAVVHGSAGLKPFKVDLPIGNDPDSPIMKKRSAYEGAEEQALTFVEPVLDLGDYSLVRVQPVSGRRHQIRVHLRHAGLPIAGDKLYGLNENFYLDFVKSGYSPELIRKLGFWRTALHAHVIRIKHPFLGEEIEIIAPLASDIKEFFKGRMEKRGMDPAGLDDLLSAEAWPMQDAHCSAAIGGRGV